MNRRLQDKILYGSDYPGWATGQCLDELMMEGIKEGVVEKIFYAHRELRVGGLIHNDVSAFRADQMPYGGVKSSGVGKEGLRYAMEEMSELRLLVLSGLDL